MRAVTDTNVVISGLLWQGPSRRILDLARTGTLDLFTSPALLIELEDVLGRRKLQRRLKSVGVDPQDLVFGYAALARLVIPTEKPAVVLEDPDDDEVLACAWAARAEVIVSGDRHLRGLGSFRGIRIVSYLSPGHRPSASALGSILPTRWAGREPNALGLSSGNGSSYSVTSP